LFCTNEDFYNPSRVNSAQQPAPIDFPGTCEIKLNDEPVNANTKGIKKQAGTAPPVDLGKAGSALSLSPDTLNKVEMVYVNTEKVSPVWARDWARDSSRD
jgi:E3 SUMO-protein ligase PIAS1